MRARGINYDTGFLPGEQLSRKAFDPADVAHEMEVIAKTLRCDAVRVSGRDPARLSVAAELAAAQGLEVWFAPFPVDVTKEENLAVMADAARRAEALRATGAEVIFVSGCEFTGFCEGFIEGATYIDRLNRIATADPEYWQNFRTVTASFDEYLATVVATVREHFHGKVTYASAPWEFIDWTPFDIVGVDAYRAAYNKETFTDELRAHFAHGKPVAVTEYGTCPYTGASELGGMAWQPPAGAVRDEGEQVRFFTEMLDLFEKFGVDTALWFTFANFTATGEDDIRSYGVVSMVDQTRWRPRELFHAIAKRYAS